MRKPKNVSRYFTDEDVREYISLNCGICAACGEIAECIESDTTDEQCESCGSAAVFGFGAALVRGVVHVTRTSARGFA